MSTLTIEQIQEYRAETDRLHRRLVSSEDAVAFVNERGYVYFWPVKDVALPSLWVAVAGERPVADEHDDPGHVTWGWKDQLLDQRIWYYAKVLRKRAPSSRWRSSRFLRPIRELRRAQKRSPDSVPRGPPDVGGENGI